jgi:hypothetical protein
MDAHRRWFVRRSPGWSLGIVALGVLGWAAPRGVTTLVEVAVLLGVLVGVFVTFGGSLRSGPPRTADRAPGPPDPDVAAAAAAVLDRLDGIEHRRLDLGHPWPAIVVGPSGVHLVDVCPTVDDVAHCASADADRCRRCEASARILSRVRRAVEELGPDRAIPVSAVAVVGNACSGPAAGGSVQLVPAHRLQDTLARGPVLPMATVDAAFAAVTSLRAVGAGSGR